MPENFATRSGNWHGGGDVVIDVDVDVAAGQHFLRICRIDQDRGFAVGGSVKIRRHANRKFGAHAAAGKFQRVDAQIAEFDLRCA